MSADVELYVFDSTDEIRELAKNFPDPNFKFFYRLLNTDENAPIEYLFDDRNIVDHCHISSVSFLGDEVPASVRRLEKFLNNELYVIDDMFISQIMVAMNLPDRSAYRFYGKNTGPRRRNVKKVLSKNKGKLAMFIVD